jgi:2-polyprenyl-3-methyl-5-hydroxy-6-metoxy-1,4-benzoquinol methylase
MDKIKKCDLCSGGDFRFLFKNYDRISGIPGQFNLIKCRNCGLVFINPRPNSSEISKYYPKERYYSLNKNPLEDMKLKIYEIFYSKKEPVKELFLSPLRFIVRSAKIKKNGNFLDIGCGDGKFLRLMKGYGMNCYGVEPNNPKKIIEKRLRILNCELKKARFKKGFFDVITLNHVLEHIDNPSETLKEIHRILKPDGTLIIATPNIGSWTAKIFGKHWVQLDTPRHLFLYSEKTLKKYAQKEGFKADRIIYNSTPLQFSGSLACILNQFRGYPLDKSRFFLNKALLVLLLPATYLFNFLHQGDQFEIILSKK